MIDIGANLADKSFTADIHDVLGRAKAAGLSKIIVTGSCLQSSIDAITLAQQEEEFLCATVGIHPHNAKDYSPDLEQKLRDLYQYNCVKAVGETGLDNHRDYSSPKQQLHAFEQQLAIASELGLPMFLHERDAYKTFFPIIKEYRDNLNNVVVHCFTGEQDALFSYLDLDLHIGITGWISDPRRGAHLPELVRNIPLDRLMIETDAPYLLPFNIDKKPKNRRNEPSLLPAVAASVASAYQLDIQEIVKTTTKTATNFFNL